MTNHQQEVAIAKALRDQYDTQAVTGESDGDRLFIRYCDWRVEGEVSVTDWTFVATLHTTADGLEIRYLRAPDDADDMQRLIAYQLALGQAEGRITPDDGDGLVLWWVRSAGDGPEGVRLSDWTPNND